MRLRVLGAAAWSPPPDGRKQTEITLPAVVLSEVERDEAAAAGFLFGFPLVLTSDRLGGDSYRVVLDGNEAKLGRESFVRLVRLSLGAFENDDGWLSKVSSHSTTGLLSHGVFAGGEVDQALLRDSLGRPHLRFVGAVLEPLKFVEAERGTRRVRLSLHPRWVWWDEAGLRKQQGPEVNVLLDRLASASKRRGLASQAVLP